MENVSTEVLDKNKEHYLRSKNKPEKSHEVLRHIQLHMSKYKKQWRFTIDYVKPRAQLLFKSRFPKSERTYRREVVNPRRHDIGAFAIHCMVKHCGNNFNIWGPFY